MQISIPRRSGGVGTPLAGSIQFVSPKRAPTLPSSYSGLKLDVDADRLFATAITSIATDDFTGADNASSLNGRTTTTGAKTWIAQLGTWGISSNQGYASAGSGVMLATIDCGQTNVLVQADIKYQSGGAGVLLGYVDNSNFVYCNLTATPSITVYKAAVGRTVSAMYGSITLTAGTTYTTTLMRNGTSVQLLVNGVLMTAVELTGAEVTACSGTGIGIGISAVPTTARYDNLLVQTAGAVANAGLNSPKEWSGSGVTVTETNPIYLPQYKVVSGHGEVQGLKAGSGLDIASLPSFNIGEMTLVIVGRAITTPSTLQQIVNIGGAASMVAVLSDGNFEAYNSGAYENSGLAAPTVDAIMAIVGSQNHPIYKDGMFAYINGASTFRTQDASSGAWATGALTTGFIGGRGASQSTSQFLGGWRRILLYNRALLRSEIRQLIVDLGIAYGISTPLPTQQLVFDGDSLTGSLLGGTGGQSYPDQVLRSQGSIARAAILGITGQTIVQMAADAAAQVDPLLDTSLTRNVVCAWAGTNDMSNTPSDPTTAFNNFKAYCVARRAAGWKVVALTCLPKSNVAQFATDRTAFNVLIRGDTSFYDALADVGADATIGVEGSQTNLTYYQASQIHLTPAGYGVVAGLVTTALAGL